MSDPRGFLKVKRMESEYRPVCERVKDYRDVTIMRGDSQSQSQAGRCMDCGTPFCGWGCPLGNYIPEWNDLMREGYWAEAAALLNAANTLPEITGRVCPALCEYACVLGINDDPVTIRENELKIIEYAFEHRLIKPRIPAMRTGKKIAVVGSGPAGLSAAMELNKFGHGVTVYEKEDKPGGILRYGIPDFKLEKNILDRRIDFMEQEGIKFITGVKVKDISFSKEYNAICLCAGASVPRDLNIPGRELKGIHFAMDYLVQQNKRNAGIDIPADKLIDARGKSVVVIGGGDTGADCVGTANRQGAGCVVQIEVLPRPSEVRTEKYPWPMYPILLKTASSHKEGAERKWSVTTKRFIGENGFVKELECETENGCIKIKADLVIIAIGFLYAEHSGLVSDLGLNLDTRGNIFTDANYRTSADGVFSAGDMRRGQSLVVWAVYEGRKAAECIDGYLKQK